MRTIIHATVLLLPISSYCMNSSRHWTTHNLRPRIAHWRTQLRPFSSGPCGTKKLVSEDEASTSASINVTYYRNNQNLNMLGTGPSALMKQSRHLATNRCLPLHSTNKQKGNTHELSGFDDAKIILGLMEDPNSANGLQPPTALERVKKAGAAGTIAYAGWEALFWAFSIPAAIFAFVSTTGEWPDLATDQGKLKVFALSTMFLTFARLAVPLRIGLALATAPWVSKSILPLLAKDSRESDER